jgi:hypothetical protein
VKALWAFIFHSTGLLSLVLLLVVLGGWLHSRRQATVYETAGHWVADERSAHSSRLLLVSSDSGIGMYRARFRTEQSDYVRYYQRELSNERHGGPPFARTHDLRPASPQPVSLPGVIQPMKRFAWQTWAMDKKSARTTYLAAAAPYWAVSLVLAPLPIAWVIRLRAARRPPPGCCRGCGYDLRASPDRCPECGRAR